ncbi:MAG TPA: DUF2721 domain-containing protein [Gemmatimonadaceae bacterium]|nr:DUF2721 domain-containing protein [Gemmatimonadaceae bacterium]
MPPETGVTAVAHVIQLAVAPVFLLLCLGSILMVMTNRLGRIVDRARAIEREAERAPAEARAAIEMRTLSHRGTLISRSISLCTLTALLLCGVIVVLFVGAFLHRDTSTFAAWLFVAGMLAFVAGLLLFLREVLAATAWLRIGLRHSTAPPVVADATRSRRSARATAST